MLRNKIFIILLFLCSSVGAWADEEAPSASPKMTIETEDSTQEEETYEGSAPIVAHFKANPTNLGNYTARYEWHIYMSGKQNDPYLIRYDQDFDNTFTQAGTHYITLTITFTQNSDTITYQMENPFSVTASESVMLVPNAFSPNGDGQNDIFKVKEGYKSIVEFHGYIFNRWGKKLFEWRDISQGWDGKLNGSDVADGVYFCRIDAKGADGKVYKIRKAVNLLRGYTNTGTTTTN